MSQTDFLLLAKVASKITKREEKIQEYRKDLEKKCETTYLEQLETTEKKNLTELRIQILKKQIEEQKKKISQRKEQKEEIRKETLCKARKIQEAQLTIIAEKNLSQSRKGTL